MSQDQPKYKMVTAYFVETALQYVEPFHGRD